MCIFFIFEQQLHNNIFFLEKKLGPYKKGRDFIDGHCIIFSMFFLFDNVS